MSNTFIGKHAVVRTYSAGVHIGTVAAIDGKSVVLTDARRLWFWKGAFTLSEVATKGLNSRESKISVPVKSILLTEAIEIIPTTERSRTTFDSSNPHEC